MQEKLPTWIKYTILIFTTLFFIFSILLAVSYFFNFPFSRFHVARMFGLTNDFQSNDFELDSSFKELGQRDDDYYDIDEMGNFDASDVYELLDQRVEFQSSIEGYEIGVNLSEKKILFEYLLKKNFFMEKGVAYTYDKDFYIENWRRGDELETKFVTAESLTITLSPPLEQPRAMSGNQVNMGMDYIAKDGNVEILIGVDKGVLVSNEELAEKTFSALLYQGIHISTLSSNIKLNGETSPVPRKFYDSLGEEATPVVDIRRQLTYRGILSKIGLLKEVHAYCAGSSVCSCGIDPMPAGCDSPDDTYNAPCSWNDAFGGCVNLAANCAGPGSNCHWVNPPSCAQDGEQCDNDDDCCEGLDCVMGSISGVCQPPPDPPSCNCSCQWHCGDIRATCDSCCDAVALPREPDDWCPGGTVSACLPPEGCGSGSSEKDNVVAGRVVDDEGRLWEPDPAGDECDDADKVDDTGTLDVDVFGGSRDECRWDCNAGGKPYFRFDEQDIPFDDFDTFVLSPPPGYSCERWNFSYRGQVPSDVVEDPDCVGGDERVDCCIPEDNDGDGDTDWCRTWGNGCTAIFKVKKDDWDNHLNYRIRECYDLVCGDVYATITGQVNPINCLNESDGRIIDVYMQNVEHADRVRFKIWTEWTSTGNPEDDLVWYEGVQQNDTTWKVTIDLNNHPGMGTVHIQGYVDGCKTTDSVLCDEITLQKNESPECASLTGPDTVLYGDSVEYTVDVRDNPDDLNYTWTSPCGGLFAPANNPPGSPVGSLYPNWVSLLTNYTAPTSRFTESCNPGSVEFAATDPCGQSATCSMGITHRYPQISGYIYDATGDSDCGDFGDSLPWLVGGADLEFRGEAEGPSGLGIQVGEYDINILDGSYSSNIVEGPFHIGSTIQSVSLQDNDLNLPEDAYLNTVCVETTPHPSAGELNPSSNMMAVGTYSPFRALPATNYFDPIEINIGYELASSLEGWFTIMNGSVYSASDLIMDTPENPGYYTDGLTNDYAFSSSILDVENAAGTTTISSRGWAYNLSPVEFELDVTTADFPDESDGLERINDSSAILSPTRIYISSPSLMEDFISDVGGDYSSRITEDGVVVVYIEGDLLIDEYFYSSEKDKKILFIVEGSVSFSEDLGVDEPGAALVGSDGMVDSTERVDIGIFASGDINFPSSYDPDLDIGQAGDSTLLINGLLISQSYVNFDRNRTINDASEFRNMYPGVAIHFDPVYSHYLNEQMRSIRGYEELFISSVNIIWDLEEED